MAKLRRPGSPWRILVHEWLGAKGTEDVRYGRAHHVTNDRTFGRPATGAEPDTEHSRTVEIEGTEFDELVVGQWIHLEQMDATRWWMNVGGVTLWVVADRDGRPKHVAVYGPDDYDGPVAGCTYRLAWTEPEEEEAPTTDQ